VDGGDGSVCRPLPFFTFLEAGVSCICTGLRRRQKLFRRPKTCRERKRVLPTRWRARLRRAGLQEQTKTQSVLLRLINIDKRWADLREIAQINLPEEEKRPLLEALGETLRRHPELEP